MKKFIIVIAILVLALLLVSCSGKKKTTSSGFIGGSEGLSGALTIESASGDNKIFDGNSDPFKIDITLENKGEDDVAEGEVLVTLDRIPFNAFGISNPTKSNDIPLVGIKREGDSTTSASQVVVQYDAIYQSNEDADRNQDLAANFCYKYKTISRVSNLCLKNKVTGPTTGEACKVDETKTAENSGSPFQVNTFVERPSGEKKVSVFLEGQNVGTGTLYKREFLSQGRCVDVDSEKNKIYVKVELLDYLDQSKNMIKCSGINSNEGLVNVVQNKLQLWCEIDTNSITQQTAFETPIRVTFDYVYKDGVSTTLTIKNAI